jgi:single-stranded DNA-binding protein
MSNLIMLEGVVTDIKAHDNENGSKRVHLTLSTRTADWRRKEDKKARDYWNVNLYVPQSRMKLLEYLVPGKIISVAGTPYKTVPEPKDPKDTNAKKIEYVNIEGSLEFLELRGNANSDKKPEAETKTSESEETVNPNTGERW